MSKGGKKQTPNYTLNTTGVGTVIISATVPDGLGKGKPFTHDRIIPVVKPPVRKGDFTCA
jgi:hypothetical protein